MSSRSLVLALTNSPAVKGYFGKTGLKNSLVRRFVAGEELRDAMLLGKELRDQGILVALDLLGEHVNTENEAALAVADYKELIRSISIFLPDAYASVKLTALGLDLGQEAAVCNLRAVMEESVLRGGVFVRVDMESSAYTQRTLDVVRELKGEFPNLGVVVQSYLRRSDSDLESLIAQGISVRLVKGAYLEPPHVAYSKKSDVDAAFRRQMFMLLEHGNRPAIATHDQSMIDAAKRFVAHKATDKADFEFQLLLGVSREMQRSLVQEGYTVRVYAPYGRSWYPYLARRLAERPANLMFFLSHLMSK